MCPVGVNILTSIWQEAFRLVLRILLLHRQTVSGLLFRVGGGLATVPALLAIRSHQAGVGAEALWQRCEPSPKCGKLKQDHIDTRPNALPP